MKKGILVGVGALLGLTILVGGFVIVKRNQFITTNEEIEASWAQVENVLQRRLDLIPNLVQVVKGYAKHEKQIFIDVAEARAKLAGAQSGRDKITANQELGAVLTRLLVVVENYPQLKANENFLSLQDELAGTENRIAYGRLRYNKAIQKYNVMVQQFPANLVARRFGFQKKDSYFKSSEEAKTAPKIDF